MELERADLEMEAIATEQDECPRCSGGMLVVKGAEIELYYCESCRRW